jgi:hypothetical protein
MMITRRVSIWLAGLGLVTALLACNALISNPTVSNIRMTTDDTGKTPTSAYGPADRFFIFADISGLTVGSLVQARWYAVSAEGLDPNFELNTSDYKYESGIRNVFFQLSTSDGSDWPKGSYRVDLYLNGNKVGEQAFTVQ